MKRMLMTAALLVAGLGGAAQAAEPVAVTRTPMADAKFNEQIRKELVMLPFLGVFDNMEFRRDGNTVTLMGQVTRPTLRSDAQRVVERIEGVERVVNNIEVLPLSPFDDRIRLATLRAVYGYGPLQRYGLGARAPIRIIVKNGNVTLEGVVANEMDRNLAFIRANGVSGVFSVTNDLRVDRS